MSCGCLKRELDRTTRHVVHGLAKTRAHRSWLAMRRRCTYPSDPGWPHYGGRGIAVCERWNNFANFFADLGECPPNHSLERIDVNGCYKPGNCRWATPAEQSRNQRTNVFVILDGCRMVFRDACGVVGISPTSVYARMRAKALTHQAAIDYYAKR
jgi:hypothetical protein